MADKAADGQRRRRLGRSEPATTQLHVAYGNALFAARGYGAPETTEAFARARELAVGDKDAPERLAADYGLWVGSYRAGRVVVDEGARRRPSSATSRRDPIRPRPESPIAPPGSRTGSPASIARRGIILERALALFQPGRDDDLAFRFGQDAGVAAMLYLAITLWPLGDIDRAVSLVDRRRDADRGPHACRHARVLEECTRPCSN